jgi:Na+-transporting methylmalonyl-CoA/oxaloacetate decarboxylase gamma subunit
MAGAASEEENHWPAYVDALTTMTMMLIFVMTILAVAIFGLSQNVSRNMVEKIAKAVNVDATDGNEATDTLAERVMAKLEATSRDTMIADASNAKLNLSQSLEPDHKLNSTTVADKSTSPIPAQVEQSAAFITVAFQKRATGLDSDTSDKIKLAMSGGGHLQTGIEIKAFVDKNGAVSDSRRIAFYRLLNLRTQLIAMGMSPDRIKARIEDAAGNENGDLVRIDLAKAG